MSDDRWPAVPIPDGWTWSLPGHDGQCESEFVSGPNAMSPCECVDRAIERGDLSPGCGRDTCPCRTGPQPVCEEWMGIPNETGRFCPRCGWAEYLHPKIKDAGRTT